MRIRGVMFKWFRSKHSNAYADEHIMVNKSAFELHKKEEEIYYKTIKFEKDYSIFIDFDYLFYDFQILCEFVEKYREDFKLQYNWDVSDLLDYFSLVLRFLKIWYYETCWIYIRKLFELWTKMFCLDEHINKFDQRLRWIIDNKISDWWPMLFNSKEVYKLYSYLSERFTHNNLNQSDIDFDKRKYIEIHNLSIVIIITISNITINLIKIDDLEKHWRDKVNNPVEEHVHYWAFVWPLTRWGVFSWCNIRFEEALKWTWIQKFQFKNWEIWLTLNKWIKNFDNYC